MIYLILLLENFKLIAVYKAGHQSLYKIKYISDQKQLFECVTCNIYGSVGIIYSVSVMYILFLHITFEVISQLEILVNAQCI